MRPRARLQWHEGMALAPQHFQYQDAYHDGQLSRAWSWLAPHAWGVHHVAWHGAALDDGLLVLEALSARLPGGALVDAPALDLLPAPLALPAAGSGDASLMVYLCLPPLKAQGGNVDGPDTRYASAHAEVPDQFLEAETHLIPYVRQRLQLLADSAARPPADSLALARLRPQASGRYEFDPAFMAPALRLAALPPLQVLLTGLLAKLGAKIDHLAGRQRQAANGVLDLHASEAASFWLLQTLTRAYAGLQHLQRQDGLHPLALYEALLALAGSLVALSGQYRLDELPAYEQADPGPGFRRLDQIIRDLADVLISSKCFPVALERDPVHSTHYRATLDPARIHAETLLFLAVQADMPALELVAAVPLRLKLGAPDDVEQLIVAALAGIELVFTPQLPGAVPVRPNTCYFSLRPGPLYGPMLHAQALSVYVPDGLPGLRLELLALNE